MSSPSFAEPNYDVCGTKRRDFLVSERSVIGLRRKRDNRFLTPLVDVIESCTSSVARVLVLSC